MKLKLYRLMNFKNCKLNYYKSLKVTEEIKNDIADNLKYLIIF